MFQDTAKASCYPIDVCKVVVHLNHLTRFSQISGLHLSPTDLVFINET